MIEFEPSLTSARYLDLAREDARLPTELHWMVEPEFNFGLNPENLEALLEPRNWLRKPPRVLVAAQWNTRSNIRVNWQPVNDLDLRPVANRELFWFRGFKKTLNHAQMDNQGAVYLIYAHIARYREALIEIGSKVVIVSSSRITPFFEFNLDIHQPSVLEKLLRI